MGSLAKFLGEEGSKNTSMANLEKIFCLLGAKFPQGKVVEVVQKFARVVVNESLCSAFAFNGHANKLLLNAETQGFSSALLRLAGGGVDELALVVAHVERIRKLALRNI